MNDRTNSIQFYYYTPTNSVNMQKYDILSAIGQGAYGVVLKCRDISSNSFVAIKKFKDTDEQQHTRKTTMREVKVLKMTNHPNIVELKEAFRKKGTVYLVFQYVQNNLLEVLQKSQNGLKLPLIRKIIFQLLKGLQYLHDQNIVHRDIKPQNLLIGANSGLKICDFGFARHLKAQKGEELTDYVATRWYRPPQLLVGGQYGKQIDMWAVACIMCELIDGNPLFPGQNQLDQLFLIQKTLGTLPSELHQKLVKNPRFLGMKFPEINNLDKLEKKYFGKICQKGLNFIKDLLKLNPKQRLTAAEALRHPYFQSEAESQKSETIQTLPDKNSRKDTYTSISTTNRKKELDLQTKLYGGTKYGKIYKRTNNAEQISNIYQSSNNCKLTNLISKSLGKQNKKVVINQDLSLDKYGKKNMLKTQAKGFYNDNNEQILHGDIFKKSMQLNVGLSNQQLPFLLNSQLLSVEETSRKQFNISKKKPLHILGQKPSMNPKQLMTHYK